MTWAQQATQAVFAELQAEFIKVETEKKRLETESRQNVVSMKVGMQASSHACTTAQLTAKSTNSLAPPSPNAQSPTKGDAPVSP